MVFQKTRVKALSALTFIFCVVLTASAEAPVYDLERLRWAGPIDSTKKVYVDNPYGNITVKQTTEEELTIHAVMQKIGDKPKIGTMDKTLSKELLKFEFRYPEGEEPKEPIEGRIDVAIVIPEGIDLELHLETGVLSAKSLANNLTVKTDGSDVKFKTSGIANIYSRDGTVTANLTGLKSVASKLQTSKGNIDLSINKDLPMNFEILTGSSITTDSLELLKTRAKKGRYTTMVTDNSIPVSTLFSDSGHIRIVVQ